MVKGFKGYKSGKINQIRHGDVLLLRVDTIPGKTSRKIESYKDRMLVSGQHSNHAHYATGSVDVIDHDGDVWLDVNGHAMIEHLLTDSGVWTREHKALEIPVGKFKVVRQVQYNPYEKAMENVED